MDPNLQQATPIPPPMMTEKPRNLGWIKWVLIIGVIAILSSAAIYFIIQSKYQKQTPQSQILKATPTVILNPDPTENWKMYTDPVKKFTFKYPPDLHIKELPLSKYYQTDEKEISSVQVLTQYDNDGYTRTGTEDLSKIFSFTIAVTENTKKLTNTDLKVKLLEPPTTKGPEAKAVSEKVKNSLRDYKNGQIDGLYFMSGWDYDYDNIEMIKADSMYFFLYSGDQGTKISKYGEDIITQIISTFRFTEQNQTQNTLVPADSQTPIAGICPGTTNDALVTVTLGMDNVPEPRCTKVTSNQKLKIINDSSQTINGIVGQYTINILPKQNQTIDAEFGSYLLPGVHIFPGSVEIWLL